MPGGGISADYPLVNIMIIFREGGAFDFHEKFVQIKGTSLGLSGKDCFDMILDRVYQVYQLTRELGQSGGGLPNVDLEELPAYEAVRSVDGAQDMPGSYVPPAEDTGAVPAMRSPLEDLHASEVQTPNEPPPGYEATQLDAINTQRYELDREEAERR